jgi:hypothetical protein
MRNGRGFSHGAPGLKPNSDKRPFGTAEAVPFHPFYRTFLLQESIAPEGLPTGLVGAFLAASSPLAVDQLNHAVQNYAHPKIDDQAQIEPVRTVPPCLRQMRHQDKEVKEIAHNDGNRLLKQFSQHVLV